MEMQQELERLRIENALLIRLLREQQANPIPTQSRILFTDFYQKWLESRRPRLQASTFFEYSRVYERYVLPYFGPRETLLADMTPQDIHNYYQHLKNTYSMSNNTLIRHHANMHTCFKYAYQKGFILSMVVDRVERPQADPPATFNYYTVDELIELIELAKGTNLYTPILLAAILGLSRSELLALKWDAIHFHAGTVTVKRKMTRDKIAHKDSLSRQLKTKARARTLALPPFLSAHLAVLKSSTALLPHHDFAEYICVDGDGNLPTLNMLTNRFRDFIHRHGLKKIRLHDLRHSCASMLQSLGYTIKDIQEWLGHSNYQTTANIYTHTSLKDKERIAQRLEQVVGNELAVAPLPFTHREVSQQNLSQHGTQYEEDSP